MTTVTLPENPHATIAPWPGEDDGDAGRRQRGLAIAATTPYLKVPGGWLITSQATPGVTYRLARDEDGVYCSCPDYERRAAVCKHGHGLEYHLKREQAADAIRGGTGQSPTDANGHAASVVPTTVVDRPAPVPAVPVLSTPSVLSALERPPIHRMPETNPARPPLTVPRSTKYNQAQENESPHFIRLLWDLANMVPPLERDRGRKHVDIRKVIYGLVHRVHTTKSGRRSYSDLKLASDIMGLGDLPARPTLTKYMEAPEITPILERLVALSAVPLSPLDTTFLADSTGLGTTIRDEQWADAKWGNAESRKSYTGSTWTKAHFMTGFASNVITAAFVTPGLANSGDSPQLPKLLAITSEHFVVKAVHADKAYLSGENLQAIIDEGARAYIEFKTDSVYRDPTAKYAGVWNSLLQYFRTRSDEFYAEYTKRAKVESVFSAFKRVFDPITRSISPTARVNEVLSRAVAYNITRVIHSAYIDGIDPFFK